MSTDNTDHIIEAARLGREIYSKHPCGCCWHIFLDDGNVTDEDVLWCIENAKNPPPYRVEYPCRTPEACQSIGEHLLAMTEAEREALSLAPVSS